MVPIWSSATIAGLPLDKYPGWSPTLATQLFTRTRGSGAEVIKRKGGAGFAVGITLFSGSLYVLALDGPRWLGPVTPLGGLLMILAWVGFARAALALPDGPE